MAEPETKQGENLPATTQPKPEPSNGAPFQTAAEVLGMEQQGEPPTPGLSQAAGLREVPNSVVPGTARGDISHVYGPGQAAVDPVAAGLDTNSSPPGRAENRAITQTGEAAAGPRPHTYIEKTGPEKVPQSAPADGKLVKPPTEEEAAKAIGPTGGTTG